eukprot:GFUD01026011.1.p1 GENE.GFUD01026011.1~~GFUD01026011.1.p1  ORF type:complete len:104 (-),score=33.92 GFUD01026011.1:478-789(-)
MSITTYTVLGLAVVLAVVRSDVSGQGGDWEYDGEPWMEKGQEYDPIEQMKQLIEQEIREGTEFREDIKNSGEPLFDPWEIDEDLDIEFVGDLPIQVDGNREEL